MLKLILAAAGVCLLAIPPVLGADESVQVNVTVETYWDLIVSPSSITLNNAVPSVTGSVNSAGSTALTFWANAQLELKAPLLISLDHATVGGASLPAEASITILGTHSARFEGGFQFVPVIPDPVTRMRVLSLYVRLTELTFGDEPGLYQGHVPMWVTPL